MSNRMKTIPSFLTKEDIGKRNIDINKEISKFDALVIAAAICLEKEKELEMETEMEEGLAKKKTPVKTASGKRITLRIKCTPQERVDEQHASKKRKMAVGSSGSKSQASKKRKMSRKSSTSVQREREEKIEELSEAFKLKIAEMTGTAAGLQDSNRVVLLIQKRLTKSDIDPYKSRMSMPIRQLRDDHFLTAAEKRTLGKGKSGLAVQIIQPNLDICNMNFQLWPTGDTFQYVFKTKWNELKKNNNLHVNDLIQVWHFRKEEELCFAVVKVAE